MIAAPAPTSDLHTSIWSRLCTWLHCPSAQVNGARFFGNELGADVPAGEEPSQLACLYVSHLPSGLHRGALLQFFRWAA